MRDALALRVVLTPAADAPSQLASVLRRETPLTNAKAEALICFGAYREVRRLFAEEPGRFKAFVTRPKRQ